MQPGCVATPTVTGEQSPIAWKMCHTCVGDRLSASVRYRLWEVVPASLDIVILVQCPGQLDKH
eukprot:365296-Chlamydomonas_euryale.AAC.34